MSRLNLVPALLAVFAAAADAAGGPAPDPALPPVRVVELQLDALQHNDEPHVDAGIERTWAFAHPANKVMTGPLERFTAMIKSPGYRMLLDHREHTIERVAVTDEFALFAVMILPASGEIVFYQWRLAKTRSGAWMTVAVSPPIRREDAI